ncbi:MAG: bifunctional diaminohydroxyphosphoribosylaminopyrimidine deaminase/5-amino-6-(5-phosphoribosylamino)uracil reductase RibD [Verrucomicrobiia bacterium]
MKFSQQDEQFMRRALALARRGVGKTSPNPAVGAVLVRGGKIIGEGWHKCAGAPHAEVEAIRQAKGEGRKAKGGNEKIHGRDARATGSTLYVTLEPCCTWGRTPPCTDAIIAAGVKRVVVAARDPNPMHNGRGLRMLRRAGIRVETGLLEDEATRMNESFNKWITTGMPFVIAKAAMSLDGKIATRTGDSKWITSEAARREAHRLRAGADAIMVGANTVIRDNPQLTVRHGVRGKQPLRVVVDARGRTPTNARLFHDVHRNRTIVVTTKLSSSRWRRYLVLRGIDVVVVPQKGRRVDLRAALRALGKRDVTSVLVEGGGELLGSMFDARLVDRVALFLAPIVIGGREAVSAVGGKGAAKVKRAVRLRDCRWRSIGGNEILLEAAVAR